jgi:hypothetical protein
MCACLEKMDGIDVAVSTRELHPIIVVIVVSGYAPQLTERLNGRAKSSEP